MSEKNWTVRNFIEVTDSQLEFLARQCGCKCRGRKIVFRGCCGVEYSCIASAATRLQGRLKFQVSLSYLDSIFLGVRN